MQLIDAEKLKENCKITGEFENNFRCVDLATLGCVIDNQPTAYDVDKVVAELTKRAEEFAWGVSEFQDGYYAGMKAGFRQAIQIIKGGGVDGD